MKGFRIAYGRIAQETNALSPLATELADFERIQLVEGDELHRRTGPAAMEVPGFLRQAELSGFRTAIRRWGKGRIEPVPLLSAWAIPGGPLTESCFASLRDRLIASLERAWPFDAVFLSMHGAMGAVGRKDPDGDLLRAVREYLDIKRGDGPRPLVAVTLDLHAALTVEMEALTDILSCYRTNPHRDHAQTARRAGRILIRTLFGEIRPIKAWRSLPMVLGGGMTLDFLSPMRRVFLLMKRLELHPRVLDVSLFMCHIWNDHPELGWGVHVITDGDQALAERTADHIAEAAWGVRHHRLPSAPMAEDAIMEVRAARLARRLGTVCMSDVSDVVGAGAAGENPRLIEALLAQGRGLMSYAPIRDAVAVAELWDRPRGSLISMSVGGRIHPEMNHAIEVHGRVGRRATLDGCGRVVALDLGHVQLAITEGPPMVMKPAFYRSLGLEPFRADICVVKSFFPFRIYFALENRKTIYARTRGVTDFEVIEDLKLTDRVFPLSSVTDWRDVDRARRARRTAS